MALVTCPECRGSVSSAAASCPRCGHPLHGAAMAVPATEAGGEQELWQGRPSAKALVGTITTATLFSAAVIAGVVLAYRPLLGWLGQLSPSLGRDLQRSEGTVWLVAVGLVVFLVGGRLARLVWRVVVLKSHRYRITNQRMVIESGVISRQIDEIDMRTVEDLDFRQSLLERLLGIGDITVISSDRTNARTRLVGLGRPRELRELLRNAAYQATHRQLFTRQT
jgi:membrane protein YdbS with pleckstrin-like domain